MTSAILTPSGLAALAPESAPAAVPRFTSRAAHGLHAGQTLVKVNSFDPTLPELRRQGDLYMLAAAVLHAALVLGVGWGWDALSLASTLAVGLMTAAIVCFLTLRGRWINSILLPVILAAFVAAEIQLGLGKSEFHFGVFVTLSFTVVYRHWLPILAAAGAFAVHHLVFDRLQALGLPVFCLTQPSLWDVALHAGYVVAQAGVGVLMAAHMRRDALVMAELSAISHGLSSRQDGQTGSRVNFSVLSTPVATPPAARLHATLSHVRTAVATVRASVGELGTAARELASSNHDLSKRTEQSAAGLQATAADLQSYTEALNASAHSTEQMADRAQRALQAARDGSASSRELGHRMEAITASASRIAEITGTIDAIAFQTNILALNAAVESARAGEAGRGFAVVAAEVRQLAHRSATAAREVKVLIESTVGEIRAGAEVAASASDRLVAIDQEVGVVADLAGRLSGNLNGQAQAIARANTTIAELDRGTQQNAALVEETAATAEVLRRQAVALEQALRGFHDSSRD